MTKPQGKDELISILCVLLRNFVLGHQLISELDEKRQLDKSVTFYTDDGDTEALDIRPLYHDANTGKQISFAHVKEQFARSLTRAIIAESHEAMQYYCNSTSQFQEYRDSSIYQFCRIIDLFQSK